MSREHLAAVLEALRGTAGLNVHDGVAPDSPTYPYVVIYADSGAASRSTLLAVSDRLEVTVQATAVGRSPESARWVAERVRGALLDARLPVPGRRSFPVTHEESRLLGRDDDVQPPVFYAVDLYRLTTVPAPPTGV